jgi:hypothetical protein
MEMLLVNHYRQRRAHTRHRNELAALLTSRQAMMQALYHQLRELSAYVYTVTKRPMSELDLLTLEIVYENRWRIMNELSTLRFEVNQLQSELTTLTPLTARAGRTNPKLVVSMSY